MSAQGSPYARLKRALAQRNPTVALATASELPRVPLGDALAVCLLILDKNPERFEAVAIRWHSRFCRDVRPPMSDAQLALAALQALGTPQAEAAAHCLVSLCEGSGEPDSAAAMSAWMESRFNSSR